MGRAGKAVCMADRKLIVALLAAMVAVAVAVSLGNWQTRRGDAKQATQARWDAAERGQPLFLTGTVLPALIAELPQRVTARGRFVDNATVFLDNRLVDGVAGFYVITPLAIEERAPWVLVNRGWVPRDVGDRNRLPVLPSVATDVTITGLAVERAPRLLELGTAPPAQLPGIWQNLDFDEVERLLHHPVARLLVQQSNDTGDGLKRDWAAPAAGVEKHRGYAFQWYALAVLIVVLTLVYGGRAAFGTRGTDE
jgi:surfeit locus 1 family protein